MYNKHSLKKQYQLNLIKNDRERMIKFLFFF